jgi:hypothetical protein
MAKLTEIGAFVILVIFGFFGAFILGIVLHEYSHANDFKDVAQNAEICGLVLPNNMGDLITGEGGYYQFSVPNSTENAQKVQEIKKYSELKAYSITFLVLLFFVSGLTIISKKLIFPVKNQVIELDIERLNRFENRNAPHITVF